MRTRTLGGVVAAMIAVAACSGDPTGPTISAGDDDFALLAYGASGAALEGTMGNQGARPFDGRSCTPQLPAELALTDAQKAAMAALRTEFRTEHQSELDALRALFEEARAARESGATRAEVRAILEEGHPIVEALREDVQALHVAIKAILTAEQLAWLESHRPRLPNPLRRGPRP